MLMMLGCPTRARKPETTSSNRSFPTSTQSLRLNVLIRTILSSSLAAISSGLLGFLISGSEVDVCSRTGTLKCFSTFGGGSGFSCAWDGGAGTVMTVEQEGQEMVEPASLASTS